MANGATSVLVSKQIYLQIVEINKINKFYFLEDIFIFKKAWSVKVNQKNVFNFIKIWISFPKHFASNYVFSLS